jgi:fluoride exporter
MTKILWVAAGSAAGGVCRYLLGTAAVRLWGQSFPWGTMAINLLGCGLIGWIAGRGFSEQGKLLLATGFCGGFTTFSAFALEASALGGGRSAAYIAASVAGGLVAFRLGFMLR